jgi:hypothetical protein
MKEPKFKMGNILKHKSSQRHLSHRLLVIGTGHLNDGDGDSVIYSVSFEKQFTSVGESSHVRTILNEYEVELFDDATLERSSTTATIK